MALVVQGRLETSALEPSDRAPDVSDFEDRFERRHEPTSSHELQLTISLPVQPGEAVVADRHVRV
jgi:hypothetical protein